MPFYVLESGNWWPTNETATGRWLDQQARESTISTSLGKYRSAVYYVRNGRVVAWRTNIWQCMANNESHMMRRRCLEKDALRWVGPSWRPCDECNSGAQYELLGTSIISECLPNCTEDELW